MGEKKKTKIIKARHCFRRIRGYAGAGAGGYMTLEATIVFQVVLMVLLFMIYAMFYLYDACLLSQETQLRVLSEFDIFSGGADGPRYLCDSYASWRKGGMSVQKSGNAVLDVENDITVTGEGYLVVPLFPQGIWSGAPGGVSLRAIKKGTDLHRSQFIRTCRKMGGILDVVN